MKKLLFFIVSILFAISNLYSKGTNPNILFILADDLGYSDLGCYGGEIQTPNINKLADNGLKFEAIYNSARCCPSRAALMTGLYPPQTGIADFTYNKPKEGMGNAYLGRLRDDCVTLGEVLRNVGYSTYYVGKWHLNTATGPIKRGFDEFYGYTNAHSHSQWDADFYIRLPEGRKKEIDIPQGSFYATDVFTDYALEFIKQGQKREKPWFLFLGHSSPHFPLNAPKETVDKYYDMYMQGWDVLREKRYEKMKKIGLIDDDSWTFTDRSLVPVADDKIANGYPGKPNPAWDDLPLDRKKDLARRMAIFAAMVDHVDQGIGRIVEYLEKTGELDNTIIMFTSDNGACYEWGPFGFDGQSGKGINILHEGEELAEMGSATSYHSVGSAWSNLSNTPLRLYKHFTHEGGVASPFIVQWPENIKKKYEGKWIREKVHLIDIMPTLCNITGAQYPSEYNENKIQSKEGVDISSTFDGKKLDERSLFFAHQGARGVIKGDWKIVWGKRMPYKITWELYNLAEDRCETNNLADKYPEKVEQMSKEWFEYAKRTGIIWE